MNAPLVVVAPGKVLLGGEYTVLWGTPAVVLAVAAHARVRSAPRSDRSPSPGDHSRQNAPLPPEVVLTRRYAEARLGPIGMSLHLDTSALYQEGDKLGLGSSAAAAAATAAWVHAAHGRDPSDPAVRREVLQDALCGHASIAPRGSGADVAASVLGGLIRFERTGTGPGNVRATPISWPPGLHLRLVWTGRPARTSGMLRKVEAARASAAAPMRRAVQCLREAAEAQLRAFESSDPAGVLEATRAHHDAMAALGSAAGVPIVESRLATIARVAAEHGGAAKPSGAGGGDVAVAFFDTEASATQFCDAIRTEGFSSLELPPDTGGVRQEEAP